MKKGKDDGKSMGPMFPRLHVNDTDKGGPRAPPRNKMALYEQFSIPSQRFNPSLKPLKHNRTNSLIPTGSSYRDNDLDRRPQFPPRRTSSTPIHLDERFHTRQFDAVGLGTPSARSDHRTKVGDEDDFMVPVFEHQGTNECEGTSDNNRDVEKVTPLSPYKYNHSINHQNVKDKDLERTTSGVSLRQDMTNQGEENLNGCVGSAFIVKSATDRSSEGKNGGSLKQSSASPDLRDHRAELLRDDLEHGSSQGEEGANPTNLRGGSESGMGKSNSNEPESNSGRHVDNTCRSLQHEYVDRGDDVSEASMVDSASGLDISPDDAVGIMGQKLFWKARRAIVNQQRVFAVQVFELHRLIKVQRLFAGSPQLMTEDGAYLGKPSLDVFPAKKLPSEYVVKPPQPILKRKFDSEKSNHAIECSAENAVGRTSLSPTKTSNQPSTYGPYLGFTPPGSVTDGKMGQWCFPQPPGHQWLVPVMSASEGLIYKPYFGPGFMGPICGPPMGTSPLTNNFFNPASAVPASNHHHTGIGVLPGAPSGIGGYHPSYGMPVYSLATAGSTVEKVTLYDRPASDYQADQLPRGRVESDVRHQNSCSVPIYKNGNTSRVQLQASKDSELQGSSASSPSERTGIAGETNIAGGGDALPLFPLAQVDQLHHDQPARVIKVVPHNPSSATESAARIFRSIQREKTMT